MAIKNIDKGSRAVLSIFVKQLLDIINSDEIDSYKITEIREHIALWVSANDLHPEEVKTLITGTTGDISVTELKDILKKLT
jgi:hypothetical protein